MASESDVKMWPTFQLGALTVDIGPILLVKLN